MVELYKRDDVERNEKANNYNIQSVKSRQQRASRRVAQDTHVLAASHDKYTLKLRH